MQIAYSVTLALALVLRKLEVLGLECQGLGLDFYGLTTRLIIRQMRKTYW